MGKFNKIYEILGCKIDIPINDLNAWEMQPDYRWVYNRINLCQYQKIEHAPMPIEPKKFPVIIKPIINLYGMGLNITKVNDLDEFYDNWYNSDFWMEFFEGEHLSWDLVILKGKIKFYTCLIGYQDPVDTGKFDYWESLDRSLPKLIRKLVKKRFRGYTGCLNIETIGGNIIEAHLRMGDIDIFPTLDILKGIIRTYKNKDYKWKRVKLEKTYFFPVWSGSDKMSEEEGKRMKRLLKTEIVPYLEDNHHIHDFKVDDPTLANPCNDKRVMWFTCGNKDYGDNLRDSIYNEINKKKNN